MFTSVPHANVNRYARKHFPPANVDGTMTKEIQRAMALLAFKPETSCSPYRVGNNPQWMMCLCNYYQFVQWPSKMQSKNLVFQSVPHGMYGFTL